MRLLVAHVIVECVALLFGKIHAITVGWYNRVEHKPLLHLNIKYSSNDTVAKSVDVVLAHRFIGQSWYTRISPYTYVLKP